MVIGTVAAVVGIFALGGFFLWQAALGPAGLGPSSPTSAPMPQSSDTSGSPRAQAELDFAGWQTYRNAEFGFEVKYPKSFIVFQEDQSKQASLIGAGEYRSLLATNHYEEQGEVEFSILFAILHNELELNSYKERLEGTHSITRSSGVVYDLTFSDFVPILVEESNAYIFLSSRLSRTFGDSCTGRALVVSSQDGGSLQLTLSRCSLTQGKEAKFEMEDEDTYSKILSTFRFVEE